MNARACDAHVEEPALLLRIRGGPLRSEGELLVQQPREEDRVELETLGAMERQEVHAAPRVLRAESPRQLADESLDAAVGVYRFVLGGQRAQAREVGLAGHLFRVVGVGLGVVTEGLRRRLDQRAHACTVAGTTQLAQHAARPRTPQERAVADLIGDGRLRECLLEGLGPSVDAVDHRHLLERDALAVEAAHLAEHEGDLGVGVGEDAGAVGFGPSGRAVRSCLANPPRWRANPLATAST